MLQVPAADLTSRLLLPLQSLRPRQHPAANRIHSLPDQQPTGKTVRRLQSNQAPSEDPVRQRKSPPDLRASSPPLRPPASRRLLQPLAVKPHPHRLPVLHQALLPVCHRPLDCTTTHLPLRPVRLQHRRPRRGHPSRPLRPPALQEQMKPTWCDPSLPSRATLPSTSTQKSASNQKTSKVSLSNWTWRPRALARSQTGSSQQPTCSSVRRLTPTR